MKINDWAGEIVRFLLFGVIGTALFISSAYDLVRLYSSGISSPGWVISTHVNYANCGRICPKYSYVKVEGRSRLRVPFKLTPNETYEILYLPSNSSIVSANTWNPYGNAHLMISIGLALLILSFREVAKLKSGLSDVEA